MSPAPPSASETLSLALPSADTVSTTAPVLIPDTDSITEHEITVDGKVLRYRATAGTLPLFDEATGDVKARIFFVSYERLEPSQPSSLAKGSPDEWLARRTKECDAARGVCAAHQEPSRMLGDPAGRLGGLWG